MTHVEVFVEEPSAEAALALILPRLVPLVTFDIHPYQGKSNLLGSLPGRIEGYSRWIPADWKLVVLLDADEGDCKKLKQEVERLTKGSGLRTRSASPNNFQVFNWLAVQELESWFLGDEAAITAAYPGVGPFSRKAKYRDSDKIPGGAWEGLESLLMKAGHHRGGLEKIRAAREIAPHLNLDEPGSKSLRGFCERLRMMA